MTLSIEDSPAGDAIDGLPTGRSLSDCSPFSGGVTGQIMSGDLVVTDAAPLSLPPSKAACKSGGWRAYVDDAGRPFRNQGQCIRFVNRRRR